VGSGDSEVLALLHAVEAPEAGSLVEDLNEELEGQKRLVEEAIKSVSARVDARIWQAFWLRAVEQREGAEVAEQLGMMVSNVYVAQHRVGRMLREELVRLGFPGP
jgi:DNA-directed RNA polymerase specialized sigma24 family protein